MHISSSMFADWKVSSFSHHADKHMTDYNVKISLISPQAVRPRPRKNFVPPAGQTKWHSYFICRFFAPATPSSWVVDSYFGSGTDDNPTFFQIGKKCPSFLEWNCPKPILVTFASDRKIRCGRENYIIPWSLLHQNSFESYSINRINIQSVYLYSVHNFTEHWPSYPCRGMYKYYYLEILTYER
jgi:hypothetical protein